jgi:hypothetical protein
MAIIPQPRSYQALNNCDDTFVLWAQVLPVRCDFQEGTNGVITMCTEGLRQAAPSTCEVWDTHQNTTDPSPMYFASALDIRESGIDYSQVEEQEYLVTAIFNENPTVALT